MKTVHFLFLITALLTSGCISSYSGRHASVTGETTNESSVGPFGSRSYSSATQKSAYEICLADYQGYSETLAIQHCTEVVETLHAATMNPCKPFAWGPGYGAYGRWPYAYGYSSGFAPGTPCGPSPNAPASPPPTKP